MATVDDLLLKNKKIQLIKSRPWNYMEEMDRQGAIKTVENKTQIIPKQPDINLLQSGNKVVTETSNKVVTNWEQTSNKVVTEKYETGNTTGNKVVTNFLFSSLVGLQKKILLFLYESCKAARSKITNPISLEHMSDMLKASIGSLKTTIRRLENKHFLTRVEYKNGRGGWSRYSITDNLFQELLQIETGNKVVTNWEQSGNKVVTNWEQSGNKVVTKPVTTSPLVASSYITTTNLTTKPMDNLPPEWQAINYESIKNIGFGPNHIMQLYKAKLLSAQLVQESIDSFAYTLLNYPKAKEYLSPLSVLMSVLSKGNVWERRGAHQAPAVPLNAASEHLERAKQEAAEQKQERESIENKFEASYLQWYESLSPEELKQIFPSYNESSNKTQKFYFFQHEARTEAQDYFRKTKWLEIYKAICDKTSEIK